MTAAGTCSFSIAVRWICRSAFVPVAYLVSIVARGLDTALRHMISALQALSLFSHLANIGDAKSLVIHPATTTHLRMDDAALAAAGITPGTVRLSIGLEHPDDLLDDLGRALNASQK